MGLIQGLFGWLFGGGMRDVQKTVEVFRPNAEAEAQRTAEFQTAALRQFSTEFHPQRGLFDRIIDGLNRLPRPPKWPMRWAIWNAGSPAPVESRSSEFNPAREFDP